MKTNNLTISNESKLTIFGGVNVIESDDLLFEVADKFVPVSYTHLRAHETCADLVCRLLLEKKK